MTTQKDFDTNDVIDEHKERLEKQVLNTTDSSDGLNASQTPETVSIKRPQKRTNIPLRTQLLRSMLPIVLLPLGIASVIGYSLTGQTAKREALLELKQHGLQVNETTDIYILDSLKAMKLLTAYPSLKEAIAAGNELEASSQLKLQPIEAVEAQYKQNKSIVTSQELNQFLQDTVSESDFSKILITSKDGFSIATSRSSTDVVQNDEFWWQQAQKKNFVGETEIDEITKDAVLPLATPIKSGDTTIGTLRANLSLKPLNDSLESLVAKRLRETETLQLVNGRTGIVEESITRDGISTEKQEIIGGETLLNVGRILEAALADQANNLDNYQQQIKDLGGISELELEKFGKDKFQVVLAQFKYQDNFYSLSTIPETELITYASEAASEVGREGRRLLLIYGLLALVLGGGASLWITKISEQISAPIKNLATKAQAMSAGNLQSRADVEGAKETQLLAADFNKMASKVEVLLDTQTKTAEEQQAAREKLEMEIQQLLDEVGDALDGDLTVRASLTSMEMSTVADLFNAIIDNLSDIAIQVKQSTGEVNDVLSTSELSIQQLTLQAVQGAQDTQNVLKSVTEMTQSIQDVAENANQAAEITDDAYLSAQQGAEAMEKTVAGINTLRSTVGETAKKMKRLGESSQKISQVVSFIDEIALKTNLLAINASVEARRAGEQGQGFAVVAEQVGALAEESAKATKEIAQIVAEIQAETNEVTDAMEVGTAQVVDSTLLVESTKTSLESLLQQSQQINDLMGTISNATESQAQTSSSVTELMERLAHISAEQSESSKHVAESIQSGSKIAEELKATVEQFKAEEETFF